MAVGTAIVAAAVGCAGEEGPAEPPPDDEHILVLRMLDLGPGGLGGGGNAILVTDSSSAGEAHALVDAGPHGDEVDEIDHHYVARRLGELGVDTLELLQMTHAHADHFGAMIPVLDSLHVEVFVHNGQRRRTDFALHGAALDRASAGADSLVVPEAPWEHELGEARFVHLPPLPDHLDEDLGDAGPEDHQKINEGSLGTFVEAGEARLFLAGDGEDQANERWRTDFPEHTEGVDILLTGHHGANNAVFDDRSGAEDQRSRWLEHTDPSLILITANGRTHPRRRALERLHAVEGGAVYCTPTHGEVEVRVAEGSWDVRVGRGEGRECEPGEEADT